MDPHLAWGHDLTKVRRVRHSREGSAAPPKPCSCPYPMDTCEGYGLPFHFVGPFTLFVPLSKVYVDPHPLDHMRETFFRLAASGFVPRSLFAPDLPATPPPLPVGRSLKLEIVSHCWQYAYLLTYQLSSLVLHPPAKTSVTMTVFYTLEDESTKALLEFFGSKDVPRVRWNWQPLEKKELFRRSLGRNLAARVTEADWIWFADCDLVFHEGAIDAAGKALLGRDDFLVFPRRHQITELLKPADSYLQEGRKGPRLLDIDPTSGFSTDTRERAVGALQITRGDVARAAGYCGTIDFYQRPVPRWRRTHDDRVFRWLLGTQGNPVEIPGIYRIRHRSKGRKAGR